ncbi:hypothetical protein D3C85_1261110 [compost metagenome]
MARTCRLRVLSSTLGFSAATSPSKNSPGKAATLMRTFWPTASSGAACSGRKKSTNRVSRSCRVAMMVPEERKSPTSTWRMPMVPEKGAMMRFLSIRALSWATLPVAA